MQAEKLEKADLLLELQAKLAQLHAVSDERDRLAEDIWRLQEDCFEAGDHHPLSLTFAHSPLYCLRVHSGRSRYRPWGASLRSTIVPLGG